MPNITPAEKRVIELLAQGCTDAQIATKLGTKITTVRTQIESARHKLDASNRVSLVAESLRKNIIK